jgi:Zn-finger nucleic acid-binding protein
MAHKSQPNSVTLSCPKCQGEMRTYERNGVLIDQCDDCRGIFLDRGEIERLIDAANPPEEPESSRGGPRRTAQERKNRGHASTVIADMLVLMASDPKHVHPGANRPASKRPANG